jgi:hypothetical protein
MAQIDFAQPSEAGEFLVRWLALRSRQRVNLADPESYSPVLSIGLDRHMSAMLREFVVNVGVFQELSPSPERAVQLAEWVNVAARMFDAPVVLDGQSARKGPISESGAAPGKPLQQPQLVLADSDAIGVTPPASPPIEESHDA